MDSPHSVPRSRSGALTLLAGSLATLLGLGTQSANAAAPRPTRTPTVPTPAHPPTATTATPAAFQPVTVFWLDAVAWRERHIAVPVHAPIAVGAWVRTIRAGRMRVTVPPQGQPLPQDGPCPGGYVVEVDDAEGHRYFALPREAWAVAVDLARASTQGSAGEAHREAGERDDEREEGD